MNETIKLKYPIKDGDRVIEQVTVRRLKVKDILEAEKMANREFERVVFLVHRASGIPLEVVEEMDVEDFNILSEKISSFLP